MDMQPLIEELDAFFARTPRRTGGNAPQSKTDSATLYAQRSELFKLAPVEPLVFGHLRIVNPGRVYWKEQLVELTLPEYRILMLLLVKVGEWATYRMVYDVYRGIPGFIVGDGEDGYRTNARSAIKRIRNKFLLKDPLFDAIENHAGLGYCVDAKKLSDDSPSSA